MRARIYAGLARATHAEHGRCLSTAPPRRRGFTTAAVLGSVCGAGAAAVAVSTLIVDSAHDILPTKYGDVLLLKSYLRPPAGSFDGSAPTHRVLEVQARSPLLPPDAHAGLAIYSYYIKEPTLQVERAYTPISMHARQDTTILSFIIKRYVDGEVSRYLHRLRPGAAMSIRGPEITWQLPPGAEIPKHIYMVRTC